MSSAARAGEPAPPPASPEASPLPPGRPALPAAIAQSSPAAAALAGIAAAAVGIGVSELVAGLVPGTPSLIVAVGSLLIALQPPGAKDLVVALFGTSDKTVLGVSIAVVGLAAGAAAGVLARRSFRNGVELLLVVGAAAGIAALLQPLDSPLLGLLNAAIGAVVAIAALRYLLVLAAAPRVDVGARTGGALEPPGGMPAWGRRRFLLGAGGLLGGALVAGGVGRFLLQRRFPAAAPVSASLPVPTEVVPPLAPAQSLGAPGITPIVIPNDRFYRIDTELLVPQVDAATWQLQVTGMVDHLLTLSYDDLLALPLFEQYVTIACVSNPVGGDLVGNALWTGVHLRQVLAAAGIQAGATQIVGRAVDGFTVGFPTSWALDPSREPMIAVGMNRVPLPAEHGYPARLIVPGLYGYVSATKWLSEIQLTTMEAFDAYWVRLGWAKEGPIVTESRIDHPADGASLAAGPVTIDGVAWAPDRGISRVEVRVDGGAWEAAQLSRAISRATWVQWLYRWTATSGTHTIEVRAADGSGALQSATPSAPFPSGARGYDRIQVAVA